MLYVYFAAPQFGLVGFYMPPAGESIPSDDIDNSTLWKTLTVDVYYVEVYESGLSRGFPPPPTPGPALTPTLPSIRIETAVPTPKPPKVTIEVKDSNGDSNSHRDLSYIVFGRMASTQPMGSVVREGVVGPNNTIELEGLIPGDYTLEIDPGGPRQITVGFSVADDSDYAFILQKDSSGTWVMTQTAAGVSGLPSTGAGGIRGDILLSISLAMIALGCFAVALRLEHRARR